MPVCVPAQADFPPTWPSGQPVMLCDWRSCDLLEGRMEAQEAGSRLVLAVDSLWVLHIVREHLHYP